MNDATSEARTEDFHVRVPAELKKAFEQAATQAGKAPDQVIAHLMEDFADTFGETAQDHEEWFRAEVEAALNEPAATIPHEDVVRRSRERRALRLAEANRAA